MCPGKSGKRDILTQNCSNNGVPFDSVHGVTTLVVAWTNSLNLMAAIEGNMINFRIKQNLKE